MTEFAFNGSRMGFLARLAHFQLRTERQRLRKGYEKAESNAEKDAAMRAIVHHLEMQPF